MWWSFGSLVSAMVPVAGDQLHGHRVRGSQVHRPKYEDDKRESLQHVARCGLPHLRIWMPALGVRHLRARQAKKMAPMVTFHRGTKRQVAVFRTQR